jgi:hypothetical protein
LGTREINVEEPAMLTPTTTGSARRSRTLQNRRRVANHRDQLTRRTQALNRLFAKLSISDPKGPAGSVVLTESGRVRAGEPFGQYFGPASRSASTSGWRAVGPVLRAGRGRRPGRPAAIAGKVYCLKITPSGVRRPIERRGSAPISGGDATGPVASR